MKVKGHRIYWMLHWRTGAQDKQDIVDMYEALTNRGANANQLVSLLEKLREQGIKEGFGLAQENF